MGKLWQKEINLDSLIEEFTVQNDYRIDYELVHSDILGSLAHAHGISKIGILSEKELEDVTKGLITILEEHQNNSFIIHKEDEDCHTAIEGRLTDLIGDAGKKNSHGKK